MNNDNSQIEGLGDIIKKLTDKLHIPPCSKCEKRRKKLNDLIPLGKNVFGAVQPGAVDPNKKGQTPVKEPDPDSES